MASKKLPRRQGRENAYLAAFALTFHTEPAEAREAMQALLEQDEIPLDAFGEKLLRDMAAHREEIDEAIKAHLKGWTLERVPRASLVALRLALAELLYGEEQKPGVAINEAVELAKKYGAETDYQCVNGLLGTVARERGGAEKEETPSC